MYDWGETSGMYFIVMEYVNGQPLSAMLRQGPIPAEAAASIGADVASALGFAHRNGVIHRDVKPGNVLLTAEGVVKVTDFGIARAASTEDHLTQTGAVMGTATYFSPEQAQGRPVDPRSDLYSLSGVVLYEMVTGTPPFVAESPVATAYKHVHETAKPPSTLLPALPAAFEAVVMQAMAKDPNERYANAEELRADLLRFRAGRPVLAGPIVTARHRGALAPVRRATVSATAQSGPAATEVVATPSPAPTSIPTPTAASTAASTAAAAAAAAAASNPTAGPHRAPRRPPGSPTCRPPPNSRTPTNPRNTDAHCGSTASCSGCSSPPSLWSSCCWPASSTSSTTAGARRPTRAPPWSCPETSSASNSPRPPPNCRSLAPPPSPATTPPTPPTKSGW